MRNGLGKAIGTCPDHYTITARPRAHSFSVWKFALLMDRLTTADGVPMPTLRPTHRPHRAPGDARGRMPCLRPVDETFRIHRRIRPPIAALHPEDRLPPSSQRRRLRRIFEPIPRPFVYLVGASLVLLVLAPFWIYLVKERLDRRPPVLSDDAVSIPVPAATETSLPPPAIEEPRADLTNVIDEFLGVRLDANLGQLQQRFTLRLQNTRGMVPEIYEATQAGDADSVTMHFYNNLLKEFWIDTRERRVMPDRIERELPGEIRRTERSRAQLRQIWR